MAEPVAAQKGPYKAEVEEGRTYFWCACGRSAKQPFCDGSHAGTGISPLPHKPEKSGSVWLCGCKASGDKPFCDGSHSKV